MKNKKGSMELGINAIVVLIIALALLGLGIGFVTKLFSSSQSKMVRIIDRTDLPVHADSLNQIVFDTNTIQAKAGRSAGLLVSVFNEGTAFARDVPVTSSECVDSLGGNADAFISVASPAQDIPPGTDVGYSVSISPTTAAASASGTATYVCTISAEFYDDNNVYHHPSRQLFIEVSS